MEKKIRAIAENTTEATVDHRAYDDCKETVEACKGCAREFNHIKIETEIDASTGEEVETEITTRKCLVYFNPAAKWPREKVGYVSKDFTVVAGKGLAVKELPVVDHTCPMATHIERDVIVEQQVKVRAGQGRTKQGGNR